MTLDHIANHKRDVELIREAQSALKRSLSEWRGWVSDQLEGTSHFAGAMRETEPYAKTLDKLEQRLLEE